MNYIDYTNYNMPRYLVPSGFITKDSSDDDNKN